MFSKTAEKCWEDKEFFEKKLDEESGSRDKFEKNKKLISFNEIPEDLIKEFFKNNINKLKI